MSIHPWIGLRASVGTIDGRILAIGVDTVAIYESETHTSTVPLHRLRLFDPAEARRRLEAAGASAPTPDYEAIGRGATNAVLEYLCQYGIHSSALVVKLGEAIGRGFASVRGGGG